MPKACVLIKTVPTAVDRILDEIKKMKAVKKAYLIYGRWDIVAFIDAPTEEIGRLTATINSTEGVRSSETLPEA